MSLKNLAQQIRAVTLPAMGILLLSSCDKVNRIREEIQSTHVQIEQERAKSDAFDARLKELSIRSATEGSLKMLANQRDNQREVVDELDAKVSALDSSVSSLESAVNDLQAEVDLYRSASN